MGLFGDVGRFFTDVVESVVKNPLKTVAAISTFGTSLAYTKFVPQQLQAQVQLLAGAAASVATANPIPLQIATYYNKLTTAQNAQVGSQSLPAVKIQGVQPMGFDLNGILGIAGNVLGGVSSQPIIQGFGNALSQIAYQPTVTPAMMGPMMGGGGAVPVANRATLPAVRSTGLTQDVFNAGVKVLGALGIPFSATSSSFSSALKRTLSSIASLARRTPAGTIVSILAGLGLTVFEATLLTAWHAQRKKSRRMNPANSKALRRAVRRVKGFHKLCVVTDVLKSRSRSVGRRCGTCKKAPCRC